MSVPVARSYFAVTPSDSVVFVRTIGLYVGGAGNLTVSNASGAKVTFEAVPVGTVLNIEAVQVWATGTTATNIVGLR